MRTLLVMLMLMSVTSAQQPTLAPEVLPTPTKAQIHAMSMEERFANEDRLHASIGQHFDKLSSGIDGLYAKIEAKDKQIREQQATIAILQRKLEQANEQLAKLPK